MLHNNGRGRNKIKGTSEEDMFGWHQGGYEKLWLVPGGCVVSEKIEKENWGGIRLTNVHLEKTIKPVYVCDQMSGFRVIIWGSVRLVGFTAKTRNRNRWSHVPLAEVTSWWSCDVRVSRYSEKLSLPMRRILGTSSASLGSCSSDDVTLPPSGRSFCRNALSMMMTW